MSAGALTENIDPLFGRLLSLEVITANGAYLLAFVVGFDTMQSRPPILLAIWIFSCLQRSDKEIELDNL